MGDKLGEGSYGTVEKVGNYAVKTFAKTAHVLQEATACFYLRGHPQIVQGIKCNIAAKKLTMKLCSYSLSEWMNRYANGPVEVKMSLLREILLGLHYIHRLHLMHADLKPGNILVWHDKDGYPHAVIGDLGFVSLCLYAKAARTARAYRAAEVITAPSHDMFSLGVVIFELFSGYRVRKQASHSELQRAAKKKIADKKIRNLTIKLLDRRASARPSCSDVIHKLFRGNNETVSDWSGDPSYLSKRQWGFYDDTTSAEEDSITISVDTMCHIRDMMRALAMDEVNPNRLKRGCKALLLYMTHNDVDERDYLLHVAAMVVLVSANFSTDPLGEARAARAARCSKGEVLRIVQCFIECNYVIDTIMSPY